MTVEQKVLKAVLLLRRFNKYQTKEEQIAECFDFLDKGYLTEEDIDDWINSLREELAKAPEQREEESQRFVEELSEREAQMEYNERMSARYERDEWDDLWDDRARSVGAVWF